MKKLWPENFPTCYDLSRWLGPDLEEKPERNYSDYSFCREKAPSEISPLKRTVRSKCFLLKNHPSNDRFSEQGCPTKRGRT